MGKYDPLGDYLANLPPETKEVQLSFEEIEKIIGEALPPYASRPPTTWWANTAGLSHAAAWLRAGWRSRDLDLEGKRVTLVRAGAVPTHPKLAADGMVGRTGGGRRRGKYAPLTEFLLQQPPEVTQLPMTFGEIEEVLGAKLPPCVRRNFKWWSNTRQLRQGRSWLSAGWAVRRLDLSGQQLVFVRESEPDPPEALANVLDGRRTSRDTVLEKGGKRSRRRGKYEALGEYFRSISAEQCEVTLEFSEIEKIIGCELPPIAHENRAWWTNTRHYPHAREWLSAGWELTEIDMELTLVGFTRVGTEIHRRRSTAGARKGAYSKLREFLKSLPTEQEQIALTFDEVERIMESRLASRARTDANWWTNADSQQQTRCWRQAGWLVHQAYLAAGIVVLRRRGSDPIRSIPNLVEALLEPSRRVSLPGPKQLCRWIRLCKQLGWYFEGTVLYEKTGDAFGELSEAEAEAVYEDYQTCKRELKRYERTLPCGAIGRDGSEC